MSEQPALGDESGQPDRDTRSRKLGLADAYSVETPDDNRALYRDWAESYDSEFADARGYVYHEGVVDLFATTHNGSATAPILDVGCGTGLVGLALANRGFQTIDGIDLSPEMLAEAATKGVYRDLSEVDVTLPLRFADASYDGVVSVGTFTHGHLGPEPLHELVRVGRPGAAFAIGINAAHFELAGFASTLRSMESDGTITERSDHSVRIYQAADDEWADDHALVVTFRRAR